MLGLVAYFYQGLGEAKSQLGAARSCCQLPRASELTNVLFLCLSLRGVIGGSLAAERCWLRMLLLI